MFNARLYWLTLSFIALLSACASRPAPMTLNTQALPETPHRSELIEQLVNRSELVKTFGDPAYQAKRTAELQSGPSADERVAQRRKKVTVSLPDTYWAQYRESLLSFDDEALSVGPRALEETKGLYRTALSGITTTDLETMASAADKDAARLTLEGKMQRHYFIAKRGITAATIIRSQNRFAQLDARFDVCAIYKDCWKPFSTQ